MLAKFRTGSPASETGKFTGKSEVSDCSASKVFIASVSPTNTVHIALSATSAVMKVAISP
jgi:hypothetical protein